jgi:hypothetical protein
MQYKYKEDNIPATIAKAIFENEKENKESRMHYRKIKSSVEQILHHPLSDRQLCKHLKIMVDDGLLHRDDRTGKRGSKVYFSSTRKCEKKYGLKIIGTNEVERRRRLYNLLIFFDIYKRMPLLTKKQLSKLLESIGSSINDLENLQEVKLSVPRPYDIPGIISKSIRGIQILSLPSGTKSNKMWYYAVIPGFSVEEFIIYQILLQKGRKPKPFSSSRTIIPFTLYTSYTRKDVEDAVASLVEAGIIKPIDPIIPGETRYNIADESLKRLVYAIWSVRMLDYELLVRRLLLSRSKDRDREYLAVYFGKSLVDKMITSAYDIRKSYKKERQCKIEAKQAVRELENERKDLVQHTSNKFEIVIQENLHVLLQTLMLVIVIARRCSICCRFFYNNCINSNYRFPFGSCQRLGLTSIQQPLCYLQIPQDCMRDLSLKGFLFTKQEVAH